jgi:hypothetical protein
MPRHIHQMANLKTRIMARTLPFLVVTLIAFSGFENHALANTSEITLQETISSKNSDSNSDSNSGQTESKKSKSFLSFLGLDKLLTKKTAGEKPVILERGLRDLQKPTDFISFKGPKADHLNENPSKTERRDRHLLNISLEEYYSQQFKTKINIGTELQAKSSLLFSLSPNREINKNIREERGYSPYSNAAKSHVAGSSVIFSLDTGGKYLDPKSFRVLLGSSFLITPKYILPDYSSPYTFGRKAYNFTFGIGYKGFQIDASFSQSDDVFKLGLSGFDLGFGYYDDLWQASLSYARYNKNLVYNDLSRVFLSNSLDPYGQIQAFEFGAIYQIVPHVSLSGKYRYYNYSNFPGFITDQHSFSFVTYFSF